MKKLFSLAFVILAGFGLSKAQNCDFTFDFDSATGELTLVGPANMSPASGMFIWTFNNGNFMNGYTVTNTYTQNTTEVVNLSVYGNSPDSSLICTSTMTIAIVLDNPSQNCSITAQPNSFLPYSYTLLVPGAAAMPSWEIDGVSIGTGFQFLYEFPGPGNYLVCTSVASGGAVCNSCIDLVIPGDTIQPPAPDCDASFFASAGPLTGFFIPTGNGYYNTPIGGGYQYSWDFGDGETSSEMYPFHVYSSAGSYNVCLTVSLNGECTDTQCQSVEIPEEVVFPPDSLCSAYFVVSQENAFEVNVVNASNVNSGNFTWTINGGGISITANGAYPEISVETTGSFELCLTVDGPNNCVATYCDSIVVDENGILDGKLASSGFTINVYSPAGITGYQTTGIEQIEEPFSMFPNPFSDMFTISGSNAKAYQILSVDGKLVKQGNINSDLSNVSTSELNSGIYFLNILKTDGTTTVLKISKK
ncbi:MAG: PKD domain-containing protein [Bacteroidetes bacterium]|nr:PKD domain-containing protein [Bacteroidota bacterium]